ncbi:MAG: CoA pyrophosphatase [Notoacmeibacter sp.]|nr:CoA pyrophosphatase [Notoacmeibacter sp.]MCC0033377.1 CoA pyrophosphatase [Brucellaceae bacterium]
MADLRGRVAREAGPFDVDEHGDHRLNPTIGDLIVKPELRAAAVLVPVVQRAEGVRVILTQRTERLRSHSGQVAFPGGRIDPEDETAAHAALRETHEEIGIAPSEVEVIGRMPDYLTGSGYRIVPVFGVVDPGFNYALNADEVDAAFEVPLAFLMSPENHKRDSRIWNGQERFFWTMPWGERYIWGVTAGIIRTIYERLYL